MAPKVTVTAEYNDKVSGGIKRTQANVSGSFGKMAGASNALSSSLAGVAKAAAGLFVFNRVVALGEKAIKAADTQAKAEAGLSKALGYTSQMLVTQASALQKVTLFGDEQTIAAGAMIAAFTKEEAQIARVIPLVQDLAQAKGMDLVAAGDLVSKTLGSSTNALSRYGIAVEGAVGSTERLESLALGLERAFGGQAEAAALAGAGGLTQYNNVIGDIAEGIGMELIPAMNELASVVVENSGSIEDFARRVTRAFVGVVKVVTGSISTISGAVQAGFVTIMEVVAKSITGTAGFVASLMEKLPDKLVPDTWISAMRQVEAEYGVVAGIISSTANDMADDTVKAAQTTANGLKMIFGGMAAAAPGAGTGSGGAAAGGATAAPGADAGAAVAAPTAGIFEAAVADTDAFLSHWQEVGDEFVNIGVSSRDRELAALQSWYSDRLAIIGENEQAAFELRQVFLQRRNEVLAEHRQSELDGAAEQMALIDANQAEVLSLTEEFTRTSIDFADAITTARANNIDKERSKQVAAVKASTKTEKQKQKEIEKINKEAEAEQKRVANANKVLAITTAVINTALSITQALSSMPPPASIVMSALVGALGIAQIAVIASQSYARGGIVKGDPLEGDAQPAMLTGGEAVFNKAQQARLFQLANGRASSTNNVNAEFSIVVNGNVTEETTEDMIEQLNNSMEELNYSGARTW